VTLKTSSPISSPGQQHRSDRGAGNIPGATESALAARAVFKIQDFLKSSAAVK